MQAGAYLQLMETVILSYDTVPAIVYRDSVFGPCIVMHYLGSFLVLKSS